LPLWETLNEMSCARTLNASKIQNTRDGVSMPISAYQQTVANDFASSTVDIKANIGKTVYDYSIGINNSSVSYSICEGNTIQKIALRANV